MSSIVIAGTVSITHNDVLFVAHQINRDLRELRKAYPDKLSEERASILFDSYTTFLADKAVDRLGFSIYDPANSNLVHHEYRYDVIYGGNVTGGKGGRPVTRVQVPGSAIFLAWVKWSEEMMRMSPAEQAAIVAGTEWDIPGKNPSFNGRYSGGNWSNGGDYGRGSLGVNFQIYTR